MKSKTVPRLAFSISEVSVSTGMGRRSIMKEIAKGNLKAKTIGSGGRGSRIIVSAESLNAWLNSSEGSHAT